MVDEVGIKKRFHFLQGKLDEKTRRCFVTAEALAIGKGGISAVSRATGMSRRAIRQGAKELQEDWIPVGIGGRMRKPGGGRKRTAAWDPKLINDMESLVEPTTRGDPESPLRWTCKSVRRLAEELKRTGHKTSHRMVAELLHELGYSLQANRKTLEGASHPDRNAQFEHIDRKVRSYLERGDPVISVDTKKKELVGQFKNGGRELRPKCEPERVKVHDFVDPTLGRAVPYGVYDIGANAGWVSVGVDHDTAAFAVKSIRCWWYSMGCQVHSHAKRLLITADAGGSNGPRLRLWKTELQSLADELKIPITVCHLPPGTSKWNKIEHRLFSFISQNWRGKPLVSHEVIVKLIAAMTNREGLRVQSAIDPNQYPAACKASDQQLRMVNLKADRFHGDWNYTIAPYYCNNGTFIL